MIVVIDYGAGNLRSVVNAIMKLGYEPKIKLEEGLGKYLEWYVKRK